MCITKNQEWFIRIRQGSSFRSSKPSVSYVKPVPAIPKIVSTRISVLKKKLIFLGFLCLYRGLFMAFSKSISFVWIFTKAPPFVHNFLTIIPKQSNVVNEIFLKAPENAPPVLLFPYQIPRNPIKLGICFSQVASLCFPPSTQWKYAAAPISSSALMAFSRIKTFFSNPLISSVP